MELHLGLGFRSLIRGFGFRGFWGFGVSERFTVGFRA